MAPGVGLVGSDGEVGVTAAGKGGACQMDMVAKVSQMHM